MHHHNDTKTPKLPLLRGAAIGLLLAQAAAFAQTSTTKTDAEPIIKLDEFRVTAGFAGSLTAAAAAKAEAPTITEQIVAEDIGKLPDTSIADALTRLTGITTQRTNGRSQGVTIRGLTGDFSTGLLNGREQVSTSENRNVEFDQYPAELLDTVTVYKTAQANVTNQGLAGSVDMGLVKPLSKGHRVVAANAYYDWTQLKQLTPGISAKGNHANLTYVDQMADKTIGIALGFAHSAKPFEGEQFQAWGYPTDPQGNFALGGTKSYVRTSHLDRDSFVGVVEYRPNDTIHSTVDFYVSRFEEKQLLRGMEIPLSYWSSAQIQPGTTVQGGLVTKTTLTNIQPVVRNDVFKRNDSPFAIGWNLKLNEKSEWPVTFDAGYSKVTRTDVNLETYSGLGIRQVATTPDTMTVQLIPGQIPVIKSTLNYADGSVLKLTDPQGWGPDTLPGRGMYGYLKYFQAKDQLGQVKAFTEHEVQKNGIKSFEAGLSFTERYKRDGEGPSGYINSPSASQVTLPLPKQVGTTDMSFLGLGRIYAYDPLGAYSAGTWAFTANTDTGIVANRFDVTEKLWQPYGQVNIDTKVGGLALTGDVGLRAIHTDQKSKGYSANGNNLNYVSDGAKYTDWAPDLNLKLKVTEDTFLRFSVARQLARPRMYDMRASRSWGYDPTKAGSSDLSQSPWSGGGGNPKLRPWRADSVDLSIEHYFKDHQGYVALAAYNKKLLSYIYTQSSLVDFSSYPVPSGSTPTLRQGVVSQAMNGAGGNIRGLEATVQLPSELLTNKTVRGFGIVLNGAYTESSVKPWGPTNGDSPIAGLARKVGNVTFYYERYGFGARISERYRSATREYITTFGPPNRGGDVSPGSGFTLAQPERVVDAQVSYTLQGTAAKGLTFYLQAYNLNNEPLVTFNNGDPRQVMNYQKYGASYSIGASYKF
jgi:iron complex outermembrane receptor protein